MCGLFTHQLKQFHVHAICFLALFVCFEHRHRKTLASTDADTRCSLQRQTSRINPAAGVTAALSEDRTLTNQHEQQPNM